MTGPFGRGLIIGPVIAATCGYVKTKAHAWAKE
jgi:hypothetical protein